MEMKNLDEVSELITQIKTWDAKIDEIENATSLTVCVEGISTAINIKPVKNSINPLEKAAMVYLDVVKEVLQKDIHVLQQQLNKKLKTLDFSKAEKE